MGKTVTDAEVERYTEMSGQPPKWVGPRGSSGGGPSDTPWMQAFLPAYGAPARPEPAPCKVLMRGGVWLDGRPQEERITAPECPGIVPCGEARELNPLPITYEVIALPVEACMTELVGAVKDRTPRAPGMSLSSQRHVMLKQKGLCIRCGKERGASTSKSYCQPCLTYTTERRRMQRSA